MPAKLRSVVPVLEDLRGYSLPKLRHDALAAATVAVVAIPQSMAYAIIAGLDPVYGLYTSIVAAVVGSMFGNSHHLITGPTNAICLMIAGAMQPYAGTDALYPMLFLLTFLVGALRFLLGLLRLGKIVSFVADSVVVGYTAGAGTLIILGQLNELAGVSLAPGHRTLLEKMLLTAQSLDQANPWAVGLAALSAAIVLVCRRTHRFLPGPLLAIVASGFLVHAFSLDGNGVRVIGELGAALPAFHPPHFTIEGVRALMGGAVAIAVVGLVEAMSISRSIAMASGQHLRPSQEFLGQGLANTVGAFFGCFPSSGSLTRSALNYSAGARTRLAGIMSGAFVAAILLLLSGCARFIPLASLAAVIVIVACQMVNQHAIRKIVQARHHDLVTMLVTIGATVLMPHLDQAILLGVGVSIVLHLWNTGEAKVRLLRHTPQDAFREMAPREFAARHAHAEIAIVHIEGGLYFGSTIDLQDKLKEVAGILDAGVYILRLKRVQVVDISAFQVIESFVEQMLGKGKRVLLCGLNPTLRHFFDKVGLTARLGEDCVFMEEDTVYASSRKAYLKAEALLAASAPHQAGRPRT